MKVPCTYLAHCRYSINTGLNLFFLILVSLICNTWAILWLLYSPYHQGNLFFLNFFWSYYCVDVAWVIFDCVHYFGALKLEGKFKWKLYIEKLCKLKLKVLKNFYFIQKVLCLNNDVEFLPKKCFFFLSVKCGTSD